MLRCHERLGLCLTHDGLGCICVPFQVGYTLLNGVCKPLGNSYTDGLFAWSRYGTCTGTRMINGYNCTCTQLNVSTPTTKVNLTLCNTSVTTPAGTFTVPVLWNVQNNAAILPGVRQKRVYKNAHTITTHHRPDRQVSNHAVLTTYPTRTFY